MSSQRLGIDSLKSIAFENLVAAELEYHGDGSKVLHSFHNYDRLTNPQICYDLLYVPTQVPLRSAFVISPYKDVNLRVFSADLVRVVLDLPYLPESMARKYEFNCEYMAAHVEAKDAIEVHNTTEV